MPEGGQKLVQNGEEIFPFEVGYLPEVFQMKAKLELGETPEVRVRCIKELTEKLKDDKRTRDIDFDENYLLQNLRARKYNVGRAYKNVNDLVMYSRKNPYMFTDFRFDVSVKCIKDNVMTMLPWRCHEGCAILAVELDNWRPSTFPIVEIQRIFVILLLQALQDPMTQVNGFKFLVNVKSSSLRYLRYCTPHFIYLLYHGTQECAPARYRGIHIVNDSLAFKTAWLVVKPFLSEKIRQRFFFHSSPETLTDHFPRSVLPKSFGGDLKDYDQSNWLKRAMAPDKLAAMGGGIMQHLDGPI